MNASRYTVFKDRSMAPIRYDLFPAEPVVPRIETPAARRTDPRTSHEAAERVTQSGVRQNQARIVLAAVHMSPGLTSAELAERLSVNRQMPARRLPELKTAELVEQGPIRKCTIAGKNAVTWWAKGSKPEEQKS